MHLLAKSLSCILKHLLQVIGSNSARYKTPRSIPHLIQEGFPSFTSDPAISDIFLKMLGKIINGLVFCVVQGMPFSHMSGSFELLVTGLQTHD